MDKKILLSLILLLPFICCDSNHQKNHDDPDWIKYLPSHVVPIVKSRLTTLPVTNEEDTLSILESNSTESIDLDENRNASNPPVVMHGTSYNHSSSNDSVRVGVPIGGIILFCILIFCCVRCCRSRKGSQGIIIQSHPPPLPPQPYMQPTVVVQHIVPAQHTLPAQPSSVQHVQNQPQYQHAPPPQQQQQQFLQQTPYPTGYETQQMLQQEWSPHTPMTQQHHQYPATENPTAPPPYGKY